MTATDQVNFGREASEDIDHLFVVSSVQSDAIDLAEREKHLTLNSSQGSLMLKNIVLICRKLH